jgi:hypothetical protein
MSKQKKWIGVTLLVLGFIVGAYTLRTAAHPGANMTTTTAATKAISPAATAAPGIRLIDLTPL